MKAALVIAGTVMALALVCVLALLLCFAGIYYFQTSPIHPAWLIVAEAAFIANEFRKSWT